MSQYQDNQSDRITFFWLLCVCSRLLSFTSLLISLSCFPRPPGFTVAQPTVPQQHGALLPTVPLGADTRHLLVPVLPLFCLPHCCSPHVAQPCSLSFSDPLSLRCPLALPPLPLHVLLPVPCPQCYSTLPWSKGSSRSS